MIGDYGNDRLYGDGGDDLLVGGTGDDFLDGGLNNNRLDGGAGIDVVSYRYRTGVYVDLEGGYAYSLSGAPAYDAITGVENIEGSDGSDLLRGNAAANVISDGYGDDVIEGLGGDDLLSGGLGADTIIGGEGDDVILADSRVYGGVASDDVIDGGSGNDTASFANSLAVSVSLMLQGTAQSTGDGMNLLTGFENLVGSEFDDALEGDNGTNRLEGGMGADILVGLSGDDLLSGGSGNDRIEGGLGIDTASYAGAGSAVRVLLTRTSAQDTRGAGVDTLVGIENVIGSAFADRLDGDAGVNRLEGGDGDDSFRGNEGNDVLIGGLGNDILRGGTGNDDMTGGLGDDTYLVDSGFDITTELANGGEDTVYATIDYTLRANFEILRLGPGDLEGIGNAVNNTIYGSSGRNTLRGGDGSDRMLGGEGGDRLLGDAGNDRLIGGLGRDQLFGGAGADRFIYDDLAQSGNTTATAEVVVDFSQSENDRIQLDSLDAIAGGADDAFSFVGAAAFSGTAGELRSFIQDGLTYVEMDVNGDAISDMTVRLNGAFTLTAGDFVL